ncbi:MAG: mechanosensitive ion channel [Planctomycetes bacterium]|nr:mechanosensitive ion channel [Planctomycetota bacterium]
MQTATRIAVLLALMLLPFAVAAQDPPPNPKPEGEAVQPKPLPPMPTAPYVKEHAEALQAHIDATKAQIEQLNVRLKEQKEAAEKPGLSEEEKAAADKAVTDTETTIKALDGQLKALEEALATSKTGPTQAQLDERLKYDAACALAEQVLKDLSPADEQPEDSEIASTPDGAYAKAIREAEAEQKRIEQLAALAESFDFAKTRVYDRLSDLEKVEYELRWAGERAQLSIDAYDHLNKEVFDSYRAYAERELEGLAAIARAREAWKQIEKTPAASLKMPEAARDVKELQTTSRKIERLYQARSGQLGDNAELVVTTWRGRLQAIQEEIDVREDYRERLEQDAERLKNILAETDSTAAAGEATDESSDKTGEMADYQKLGKEIDDYKQSLKDNRIELDKLAGERDTLSKLVITKRETEKSVTQEVEQTQAEIDAIEYQFLKPDANGDKPKKPSVEVKQYERRPAIVLFALREHIKAVQQRLSNAKRDTRQAQTQLEVVERRAERLKNRNAEIENELLPETRVRYYEAIAQTSGIRAAKVIGVLLVAWLLLFLIRKLGEPLIEGVVRRADKKSGFSADEQQRARTLMTVFMTTARVVVYITAIMFAIAQFDVDYGPLLVAAGGVSLAVGFGAQTLVKDFFAGFFILLEGQFSIGDVVEINGKTGTVENLNLRTTVIRSLSGDVHTIPNGEISVTTNQTKLWSRAIVDIGVGYEENTDDVGAVLEIVAKEMRDDEVWGKKVLDAILMGVTELGDSAVTIRMLLKTRAGEQWGVSREFLRRCKLKFDELGIEIPWPQRVVSYKSYADQDSKERAQDVRRKRANLLRYVRKMRGELTEEEIAMQGMSVEERDRAETLANREAELHKERKETNTEKPVAEAVEDAEEAQEQAEDNPELTDAEKLARKLATQKLRKEETEKRQAESKSDDPPPEETKKD